MLGHENSGWVEAVGDGVSGFTEGDAYLVYGPVGCGHCSYCSKGQDTYCENAATNPYAAIGLGRDGAWRSTSRSRRATSCRSVTPTRSRRPAQRRGPDAVPRDQAALPNLAGGGRHVLVVGLGGLGQIAVQILTALTGATVIATDTKQDAMERAAARGAVTVPAGPDQAAAIRELTGGKGVDAAFDFVGATPTIATAKASMAIGGRLTVVGIAGGTVEWNFFSTPYESTITNTYWGTIEDLHEVVAMYRAGQIEPDDVERFALRDALEAYRKLEAGELSGRAVVVPTL